MEVWPDNWTAVTTFRALGTQWRMGMSGPTGLDYGVIEAVLKLNGVPRKQWTEMFDAIRIMEDEALTVMSED